jgi:hypothetical protein
MIYHLSTSTQFATAWQYPLPNRAEQRAPAGAPELIRTDTLRDCGDAEQDCQRDDGIVRSEGLMEWHVKADENDEFINRCHFWFKDPRTKSDHARSFSAHSSL